MPRQIETSSVRHLPYLWQLLYVLFFVAPNAMRHNGHKGITVLEEHARSSECLRTGFIAFERVHHAGCHVCENLNRIFMTFTIFQRSLLAASDKVAHAAAVTVSVTMPPLI